MMTSLGKIGSQALVFDVTKYDLTRTIRFLQQMKRPEIEVSQVLSSQDKSVLQKSFDQFVWKGEFKVIFARDKWMQSFRSFINEGKYPVWVKLFVVSPILKMKNLSA